MKLRPRLLLAALLTTLVASVFAQDDGDVVSLIGHIDERNNYISPGGVYSIQIPVLAELGGTVQDTAVTATFRDPYGVHVAIGCIEIDAPSRAELEKRGKKDFLSWLYAQQVQPEYQRAFPGTKVESAKYLPSVQDGTLLVMTLIPGGSAFRDRIVLAPGEPEPVAKRGSLVFIKNDRIFVITTELYERAMKRDTFKKTPEEEDALLRARLMNVLGKMTFAAGAAPVAATTK